MQSAADFGLMVATDQKRATDARHDGLETYVAAAGAKSAGTVETLVQDEKVDTDLRAIAAEQLLTANPQTTLYTALLPRYDTLPAPVRGALARAAGQAKDVPGADAFVIRYLNDKSAKMNRFHVMMGLSLPPTPALIAALKELEKDPELGVHVKNVIQQLERDKK